jgi:CDP-diacylglycerol--serine O-phosphatidyltransferase
MRFLYEPSSHFNLANLLTMVNIACGLVASYLIVHHQFALAALFAWIGGAFDIFDGKVARKFNLSNAFGVQLDSFADFLSFVLVPVFFIFEGVYGSLQGVWFVLGALVSVYYVISGLRRLIQFNLDASPGEVGKFFVGVPTPLGAILLWLAWLGHTYGVLPAPIVVFLMALIGWLLNSTVKVPHP